MKRTEGGEGVTLSSVCLSFPLPPPPPYHLGGLTRLSPLSLSIFGKGAFPPPPSPTYAQEMEKEEEEEERKTCEGNKGGGGGGGHSRGEEIASSVGEQGKKDVHCSTVASYYSG